MSKNIIIMRDFFAHMYEWFGLIPFYSRDLSDFLKGWDYACTGYFALPWYTFIGLLMFVATILVFALQYDLVSGERFKRQEHWWLAALIVALVNFAIAFTIPAVAILRHMHCPALVISFTDCILFGVSVSIWSLILFSILSLGQRFIVKRTGL
jgi:hypothetical protein